MNKISLDPNGMYIGRVWRPEIGPSVVLVQDEQVIDITSPRTPTTSDLLALDDLLGYLRNIDGETIGSINALAESSMAADSWLENLHILAPNDLQAIKASGVTFASSMIERVIEERAEGNPARAAEIREHVSKIIGGSLTNLEPGSPKAAEVKELLIKEGLWSQYLEVGIGPYAEIFTKSQPMSAVGWGARVGLHPDSRWNNPEPEIVLAVNRYANIVGVTMGNDVNLRDFEGRSALLLGRAKDNNASASIGPFIRLFDNEFTLESAGNAVLDLEITGKDGYRLNEQCSMSEISRSPADLVEQAMGSHHHYPDGMMLYLGSLFSPVDDRDEIGGGFTHHIGDIVTISCTELGSLVNSVDISSECPPWAFGTASLMRNLASRNLLA